MPTRTPAQEAGNTAEARARKVLELAGLTLVARNWLCRHGELDLIMQDGPTLVFVEVRQRRKGFHATAAESIDNRKRMRIIRAAQHYLQTLPDSPPPCRFDVVCIDGPAPSGQLQWLPGAFDSNG